jgi:hypothetical protein
MSTVLFGALVADARGKLGGMVLSKSAGGNTARNKTKPVNPRTSGQEAARARLTAIAWAWDHAASAQQRADWISYSAATAWTNSLGQSITMSGMSAFMRLNGLRRAAGLPIALPAPTSPGHAGNPLQAFTANVTTNQLVFAEPPAPFAKEIDGRVLVISQFAPCLVGRLSAPKGKIYVGNISGGAVPPVFPYSIGSPYTLVAGQRIFTEARFLDEKGRVGSPTLVSAIAAVP